MFLWFLGGSWVCVWTVLRDPAVDYRLVMAGALLADVIDAPQGGARVAHTLAACVALLMVVMLTTRGRRALRRQALAVPIGAFVHLLLDGMWTDAHTFWWPAQGWSLRGGGVPSLSHPWALTAAEELIGALALGWCWRRFDLGAEGRFRTFMGTGTLCPDAPR